MANLPDPALSPERAPRFPQFKPLEVGDREIFRAVLRAYQPQTSELTFSNLFIWQGHYGFHWSLHRDWLLILGGAAAGVWALPPLGPPPRKQICCDFLAWLREELEQSEPRIERADPRLAAELAGTSELVATPMRDHFDYVYRSQDLIQLPGGHYIAKRNHIHSFTRSYRYRYEPLEAQHLAPCRNLIARWCKIRRCEEDLSLMGEWGAIEAMLANYQALQVQGGVILVDGQVEAFTVGELLNNDTAVIHIEKANPEMRGLYPLINQQFCQHAWAQVPFINREQDLGEPGLRVAKMSYHPHHLVEKFRISLSVKM